MPRLRWIFLITICALIILITGTIWFFEMRKVISLSSRISYGQAVIAEKQRNIDRYLAQIRFFRTNEGIAHLGREYYNFTFPGEQIFIIQEQSKDSKP